MNFSDAREAMVDNQIRPADVVRYDILKAFLMTKREHFVPEDKTAQAYGEYEISIAADRAMMTPRSFAKLVELADPKPNDEVLLIGAGLGYEAAIISQLTASVIAIENVAALIKKAEQKLTLDGYDSAVTVKGALRKGSEENGPYDMIFFAGAVQDIPEKLSAQLKDGGRIVAIFEEDNVFTAKLIFLSGEKLYSRSHFQAAAPILPGFEKKAEFSL